MFGLLRPARQKCRWCCCLLSLVLPSFHILSKSSMMDPQQLSMGHQKQPTCLQQVCEGSHPLPKRMFDYTFCGFLLRTVKKCVNVCCDTNSILHKSCLKAGFCLYSISVPTTEYIKYIVASNYFQSPTSSLGTLECVLDALQALRPWYPKTVLDTIFRNFGMQPVHVLCHYSCRPPSTIKRVRTVQHAVLR